MNIPVWVVVRHFRLLFFHFITSSSFWSKNRKTIQSLLKRFAIVAALVAIESIARYSMHTPVILRRFTIEHISTNLDKSCHKQRKGLNITNIDKQIGCIMLVLLMIFKACIGQTMNIKM